MASSGTGVTDVRAQKAYVAQYVAERQAVYGVEPVRRQKKEWKARVRTKWEQSAREAQEKQGQSLRTRGALWKYVAVVAE